MINPVWHPNFTMSSNISGSLKRIEMVRLVVETVALPMHGGPMPRDRARVRASFASASMEGGSVTLEQVAAIIADETVRLEGQEDDAIAVRNYGKAIQMAEQWAKMALPLTETLICRFHRLAITGKSSRPTPLRKRKITEKYSFPDEIAYLPPRPEDLPELIAVLEIWAEDARGGDLPVPVVAGIMQYQLYSLCPFNRGNGRTARLCSNYILERDGYSLAGLLVPEEQYAGNLESYCQALGMKNGLDYYEERAHADITPWLEYYLTSLAKSCETALSEMAAILALRPEAGGSRREGKRKKSRGSSA
ncbi:MAG TPA: Fic family protein [Methanothrix sp.]|nr:Fic family protein [Methanothrix sp.]